MFRFLVKVLFIVLPTSLLAEGTARDAQGMLSRLGYQISVDGSWGPQSQRVIGQFYTDRGLTYDGTLSENEFTDLNAAIEDLPYMHPRAKLVDYEPQYNFSKEIWPYFNLDEYREHFRNRYGDVAYFPDLSYAVLSSGCQDLFSQYDIFRNVNWEHERENRNSLAMKLLDRCLGHLVDASHNDFITSGRNSKVLSSFFETWVPLWTSNRAFSAEGSWSSTESAENADTSYMFSINKIVYVYTRFAKYWGTTAELDQEFREWWDYISQYDPARLYQPGYEQCREFSGPNIKPDGRMHDECMNSAADYASALIHMGMYFKDSDYINEGIFVAGQVAKTSSPEGFVLDGIRASHALGYMAMTTQKLDQIALILDDIDLNLYEVSFASHGRTVRDLIEVTAREWIKPDRVFDYACPNEMWYPEKCNHQDPYDLPNISEIDWNYSMHLRTQAGALWNNPDFMPFLDLVNPDGHLNGFGHGEGGFNQYIMLKHFPPRNQYYLQDPTSEDRNVYRGDLGSSEYIKMITNGLVKILYNRT